MRKILTAITLLAMAPLAWASEPTPVPLTRPEMKLLLEKSKSDVPRLKAPATNTQDRTKAEARGATSSRMENIRSLLPPELWSGFSLTDARTMVIDSFLRDPNAPEQPAGNRNRFQNSERDPNMTLDPVFKVQLRWIASRLNNCVFCMGHQEYKLAALGMPEDRIAALDGDWSEFTLPERAVFNLTRKLTVAPHTVSDADVNAVRKYYPDLQVLEIIASVAGYSAMNRWTGPLRLTQQSFRDYLTPTSPKYASSITKVAPVPSGCTGARCAPIANPRPALEPRSVVESKWTECRDRKSRFALVDESAARALLAEGTFPTDRPLPNWVRLLANFPKAGVARIEALRASETKGNLPPRLNAELAWVSARADHAWYALAHARDRLRALGQNDDAIFAIDQAQASGSPFTPAERAAFAFTRKLTVDPALIDDGDFNGLRKYYSEPEIAELIHHVNHDLFFSLVTEASQLPLDGRMDGEASNR